MEEQVPRAKKTTRAVNRVRRHWMTIAFFLGFVVDNLTLNRVDQVFDNLVLLTQVILAITSITLLYAALSHKFEGWWRDKVLHFAPMVVQYSFGGLLSGMLIFYGRSGDWSTSWPFMLIILIAIYGNETIEDRASRFLYNLAILFIGLFSYVVLVIPVLTGQMGPWVFVGSGFLALFIMYWFVQLLYRIIPHYLDLHMKSLVFILGFIFAGFNFLYFTNIIPPIPLSLKDVGVYHSVIHFPDSGAYELKYEKGKWWQPFKDSDTTYHAKPGDNVFCFAKVFAPTKLATDIYHTWEYQDSNGDWVEHLRMSYYISGGRSDGYRGYTLIQNYRDGKWRCSVETKQGQVLGREEFIIDSTKDPAEIVTTMD